MPPGLDYTIFAVTDLSMCTSSHDGGTSFLEPYSTGARLKVDDSAMNESSEPSADQIDPTYGFADFIQSMDIILCGRGSYDQIMHCNSGQWPYPKQRLIVFTSTPLTEPVPQRSESSKCANNADCYQTTDVGACLCLSGPQLSHHPPPPNAEAFSGDPLQLVQKLAKESVKARKFKRESVWVMGGPAVRGAMLQLGVVERVELVMVPRVMSSPGGIPLWSFGDDESGNNNVDLELIDCRSYENGVVSLSYSVVGRS